MAEPMKKTRFYEGDRVSHLKYGPGMIEMCNSAVVTVRFDAEPSIARKFAANMCEKFFSILESDRRNAVQIGIHRRFDFPKVKPIVVESLKDEKEVTFDVGDYVGFEHNYRKVAGIIKDIDGHNALIELDEDCTVNGQERVILVPIAKLNKKKGMQLVAGYNADLLRAEKFEDTCQYSFFERPQVSEALFTICPNGGKIGICLNSKYDVFRGIAELLEKNKSINHSDAEYEKVLTALRILLTSWASYENNLPEGKLKEKAEDARTDWGRIVGRLKQ